MPRFGVLWGVWGAPSPMRGPYGALWGAVRALEISIWAWGALETLYGVSHYGVLWGGEGNFSAPSLISYGEVLGGGEPNGVPHYRDPMGRGTLELSISTGMGNSGVTHRVSYWGGGGIWGAPFPLPYGFREQWGAPEENIIG